jgi:hypothetical protein
MSLTGAEKAHRLQKALDCGGHATHRMDDVVQMLRDGTAQLWEQGDGCIITEVQSFPLGKSVYYWLIFGSLHDCLALEPTIDAWAREQGCIAATAMGRKGWGRVAYASGWRPHFPTFYKPLVIPDGS